MHPARGLPCLPAALIGFAIALLPASPAGAQPGRASGSVQWGELEMAALAMARTEMLDHVRALPLGDGAMVADWLRRSEDLDRDVRLWARSLARHRSPRHYSDEVCEVDVRLSPVELRLELLKLLEDYPEAAAAAGVDEDRLREASRNWPELWATGRASPTKRLRSDNPPGWEDVTARGVELAELAATADAYHALLSQAGRLKVTPAKRLRDFLSADEEIGAAVRRQLRRVADATVELAPDQVAVATVRVRVRDLPRILTDVHERYYRGSDFEAADFRGMVMLADVDELVATGLAPPPSDALLRGRYQTIDYNAPAWAAQTITATGRFVPQDDEEPEEYARREAARLDGVARLSERIEQLEIQQQVTVAEFAELHQDIKADVALLLSAARVVGQPRERPDGTLEVRVELPLCRLWELVRQKMKLEEVDPERVRETPSAGPSHSSSEDT